MEKWPNFFIVGAPKCGTTSLHEYLKRVNGIFMSELKEPYYFCPNMIKENDPSVNPIRNKTDYLNLFKNSKQEIILGESSVHYLADPQSSKLIHNVSPNAKILISLRDPVERLFSSYLMQYGRGFFSTSFHQQLEKELNEKPNFLEPSMRLNAGMYYENVKNYFETFGKTNVKVIIFEDWIINFNNTLRDILKFLGVNYEHEDFDTKIHNEYKVMRGVIARYLLFSKTVSKIANTFISQSNRNFLRDKVLMKKTNKKKMGQIDREILIKYYNSDVKNIKTIINHDLPWPNFAS